MSVALGANATFVARTHDLDRKHMQEVFRAAHDHKGAAFVEIWQNCNVFNDGVFDDVLAKEQRPDMLMPLVHGQPIRFGTNDDKGVVMGSDGQLRIVAVADVGEDALLVHDAHRDDPGLAFALAHLSANVHQPTPFGVFRQVERPEYATESSRQLLRAAEQKGSGDLGALLRSNGTWIGRRSAAPQRGAASVTSRNTRPVRSFGQKNVDFGGIERALVGGGADLGDRHRPQQHAHGAAPACSSASTSATPCWNVEPVAHAGQGVVEAGRVEVAHAVEGAGAGHEEPAGAVRRHEAQRAALLHGRQGGRRDRTGVGQLERRGQHGRQVGAGVAGP